jgi:hypothetical protein
MEFLSMAVIVTCGVKTVMFRRRVLEVTCLNQGPASNRASLHKTNNIAHHTTMLVLPVLKTRTLRLAAKLV